MAVAAAVAQGVAYAELAVAAPTAGQVATAGDFAAPGVIGAARAAAHAAVEAHATLCRSLNIASAILEAAATTTTTAGAAVARARQHDALEVRLPVVVSATQQETLKHKALINAQSTHAKDEAENKLSARRRNEVGMKEKGVVAIHMYKNTIYVCVFPAVSCSLRVIWGQRHKCVWVVRRGNGLP